MRLGLVLLVAAAAMAQTFPSITTSKVIHKVDPEYTKEAIEAKLQGTVILSTVISEDGAATEIKLVRGLGLGLDEKAIECLQQWRFSPAIIRASGQPMPSKARIEINFRLPPPAAQEKSK